MSPTNSNKTISIIRKLNNGLILRHGNKADSERLAEFNARIHWNRDIKKPDMRVAAWTKDLLSGEHPTFQPEDFTIVEDEKGRIVSSMNLIEQTWTYAGIPVKVGRPELVGTDPDLRHQNMVRQQFEVIHQWARERGELVQAITGIPYFYRLFGYEMALELDGERGGNSLSIPEISSESVNVFSIREATEEDLSFIADLYDSSSERYLIHCQRNIAEWQYELGGKSRDNVDRLEIYVIEDDAKIRIGFFLLLHYLENETISVRYYELVSGKPWHIITPQVVKFIWGVAQRKAEESSIKLKRYSFKLGSQHTAYQGAPELFPNFRKPYAFYLRVPDLPALIRIIKPVIEDRLYQSPFAGYHGNFSVTFYHNELRMVFDQGRLNHVEEISPSDWEAADVNFPGLTFLQLIFGYRSVEEIQAAFPDCIVPDKFRYFLNAIFPKKPSLVLPIS